MTESRGTARHRPGRRVVSLILLAKVLIIGGLVLLPSGVAISVGAAHGVALVVVGMGVAAVLLGARRRGGSRGPGPLHPPRLGHGPRSVLALARRHAAKIFRNGEG